MYQNTGIDTDMGRRGDVSINDYLAYYSNLARKVQDCEKIAKLPDQLKAIR